jgi:hypothetical protein
LLAPLRAMPTPPLLPPPPSTASPASLRLLLPAALALGMLLLQLLLCPAWPAPPSVLLTAALGLGLLLQLLLLLLPAWPGPASALLAAAGVLALLLTAPAQQHYHRQQQPLLDALLLSQGPSQAGAQL